jgi:hypothetical protein
MVTVVAGVAGVEVSSMEEMAEESRSRLTCEEKLQTSLRTIR